MKYIVMLDPNTLQLKEDGTVAEYASKEEARGHSGPGDSLIPIASDADVIDFQTGKQRLPVFNRSGLRD